MPKSPTQTRRRKRKHDDRHTPPMFDMSPPLGLSPTPAPVVDRRQAQKMARQAQRQGMEYRRIHHSDIPQCIITALDDAGPVRRTGDFVVGGLTREELADEVTRRRGILTKETSLTQWLLDLQKPTPDGTHFVNVSSHRRRSRAGQPVTLYQRGNAVLPPEAQS